VDLVPGESTRGTLLCAVTAGEESDHAVELGLELSTRLGLRLVLAHAVPTAGRGPVAQERSGEHGRAEHRLARLAEAHGVDDRVERRVALGDPAVLLGRIAAEEAAAVVVVGAAERGWRRGLDMSLARELETETPAPVIVALPRKGRGRRNAHGR
jgi:nucleotide-binding universal stress UspA family protein